MAATATSSSAPTASGPARRPAKRQQSWGEQLLRKRGPGVLAFIAFIAPLAARRSWSSTPTRSSSPSPGEVWDEWMKAAADGTMWAAVIDSTYAMGDRTW